MGICEKIYDQELFVKDIRKGFVEELFEKHVWKPDAFKTMAIDIVEHIEVAERKQFFS